MSKNIKQNVIWVDFKSKRIIDLSEFGRPAKPTQPKINSLFNFK
jgi:hypothetical protein